MIEQRKRLTVDPGSRDKIAQALGAISETPESFDDDPTAYLAMRSARARLLYDQSAKAIEEVQSLLWETARRIEDGRLPLAERTDSAHDHGVRFQCGLIQGRRSTRIVSRHRILS